MVGADEFIAEMAERAGEGLTTSLGALRGIRTGR